MTVRHTLGVDVGGANLKFASTHGDSISIPFEMWKRYEQLSDTIVQTISDSFTGIDRLVVTMTGELADCFESKSHGVRFIAEAIEQAAASLGVETSYYGFDGIESCDDVVKTPLNFAAANWHAIANYFVREYEIENGLIIDCGSTTTDIIPVVENKICCGATDAERLKDRSLVYAGVRRTPLFGLVKSIIHRGADCSVARELFATTQDVYQLLGYLAEEPDRFFTADGAAQTIDCAIRRLGRVICANESEFGLEDALSIAEQIQSAQIEELVESIYCVFKSHPQLSSTPVPVVSCGEGEFLIKTMVERSFAGVECKFASQLMSASVSDCLGAFAVAWLFHHQTALSTGVK